MVTATTPTRMAESSIVNYDISISNCIGNDDSGRNQVKILARSFRRVVGSGHFHGLSTNSLVGSGTVGCQHLRHRNASSSRMKFCAARHLYSIPALASFHHVDKNIYSIRSIRQQEHLSIGLLEGEFREVRPKLYLWLLPVACYSPTTEPFPTCIYR